MTPYIQTPGSKPTLEYWHDMLSGNVANTIAAFAYVTDSGAAKMHVLKKRFQSIQKCRWIFGIDYGRSHPTAIRKMAELARHGEVRIYDGNYVVNATGFTPRESFHLKTVLTVGKLGCPRTQLVGSGNLSGLGLTSGIEAGCLIDYTANDSEKGRGVLSTLEGLWLKSVPFGDIIDRYQDLWAAATAPIISKGSKPKGSIRKLFWVDVGYVTKNRGELKPGNQFDLPRGSHVHLGLPEVSNPARNSILGDLKMRTPSGAVVSRSLRFGNNSMEKLTLPIPEDNGYEAYDGKILTLERRGDSWTLECFEHDDFERVYRRNVDWFDRMQSGRLFGTITI